MCVNSLRKLVPRFLKSLWSNKKIKCKKIQSKLKLIGIARTTLIRKLNNNSNRFLMSAKKLGLTTRRISPNTVPSVELKSDAEVYCELAQNPG